jgi:hypothetical protein
MRNKWRPLKRPGRCRGVRVLLLSWNWRPGIANRSMSMSQAQTGPQLAATANQVDLGTHLRRCVVVHRRHNLGHPLSDVAQQLGHGLGCGVGWASTWRWSSIWSVVMRCYFERGDRQPSAPPRVRHSLGYLDHFCALELEGPGAPDECPPMNGPMAKFLRRLSFGVRAA